MKHLFIYVYGVYSLKPFCTDLSTFICTILLYIFTKWLPEAMFVNFLSRATCDKEIHYVGSG